MTWREEQSLCTVFRFFPESPIFRFDLPVVEGGTPSRDETQQVLFDRRLSQRREGAESQPQDISSPSHLCGIGQDEGLVQIKHACFENNDAPKGNDQSSRDLSPVEVHDKVVPFRPVFLEYLVPKTHQQAIDSATRDGICKEPLRPLSREAPDSSQLHVSTVCALASLREGGGLKGHIGDMKKIEIFTDGSATRSGASWALVVFGQCAKGQYHYLGWFGGMVGSDRSKSSVFAAVPVDNVWHHECRETNNEGECEAMFWAIAFCVQSWKLYGISSFDIGADSMLALSHMQGLANIASKTCIL